MPLVSRVLQATEHRREIDVAFTRDQVHFLITVVVGQAHLADTVDTEGVQEAIDAVRHQVGVVDGEGHAEVLRGDGIEVDPALFDRVGQVMYFGIVRLKVQVLQQQHRADRLCICNDAFQPCQRGVFALLQVGREVEPGMDDCPLAPQLLR